MPVKPVGAALPRIVVIDTLCPSAYCLADIERAGLGGTEATVMRVAHGLASHAELCVQQAHRECVEREGPVHLQPVDIRTPLPSDTIACLVINSWKVALAVRRANPMLSITVWLHVFPGKHNRSMGRRLRAAQIDVVCVSQSQCETMREAWGAEAPRVTHIYNLVEHHAPAMDAPPARDINRLLFASSPHKGLREVLTKFAKLRLRLPHLQLMVADPGYLSWEIGAVPSGVTFLGQLAHREVLNEMRKALCLFYPQTTFAETFGLVIAEANAMACPALVHTGLGANDEVVSSPTQAINCSEPDAIEATVMAWRSSPPNIGPHKAFSAEAVIASWVAYLKLQTSTNHP